MSRQDHTGLLSQYRKTKRVCGLQQWKGSETVAVILIKATTGSSFPTKPSDHLLPLPGPLLVGRSVNGGAQPRRGALGWARGLRVRAMAPNIRAAAEWVLFPGILSTN